MINLAKPERKASLTTILFRNIAIHHRHLYLRVPLVHCAPVIMADITAARATVAAYAAAVAKGANPSTPRSEVISSMTKFYLPG